MENKMDYGGAPPSGMGGHGGPTPQEAAKLFYTSKYIRSGFFTIVVTVSRLFQTDSTSIISLWHFVIKHTCYCLPP
jgi:hypothetical protein